MQLTVYMLV